MYHFAIMSHRQIKKHPSVTPLESVKQTHSIKRSLIKRWTLFFLVLLLFAFESLLVSVGKLSYIFLEKIETFMLYNDPLSLSLVAVSAF